MRRLPAAAFALAVATCALPEAAPPQLGVARVLPIGGAGGWDYLSLDSGGRRLFVTRRDHLQVIDARSGALLGDVGGLRNAHGVALDEARGLAFVTNGGDDSVVVLDLRDLSVVQRIATTGRNPDAILYEPLRREIYAFNHSSGSVTVIDPARREVVASIEAAGALEAGVSDGKGRVYVNAEDRNEVHVLDVWTRRKVASWALPGCKEPTGIAMDLARRRLFSACKNGVMVVLDADSGRDVARLPIGAGSDGAAYDAALRLAYSSNRDGTLSVVRAGDADRYEVMPALATAEGAKTIALDPRSHRVYLPVADLAPAQGGKPRVAIAGTFRVLVVAPR